MYADPMRWMGAASATNPFNIPGLPGYDPTQPSGVVPAPVAPGAPAVVPAGPSQLPALPSTGSPMDPTLKAQFIAAVPNLSAAQQQDLYDIGSATPQAHSARLVYLGGGLVAGLALAWGLKRARIWK